MRVPDAVKRAVEARASAGVRSVAPLASREVQRGDLRLIDPPYAGDSPTRLGLVLEVGADGKTVEIALTHSSPDLATAFDGIVPGVVSGTSYPVVVESDLRGVVWRGQVGARVGHLTQPVLEAVSRRVAGDLVVLVEGVDVGTRLLGRTDRRWAFKEAEGAALDALCADCSTEMIRGPGPWQLGRELLLPTELSVAASDAGTLLEELAHWFETRDVRIDLDTALWLEESGALEEAAWEAAGLDFDIYEMILSAVEAAILGERSPDMTSDRAVRGPVVGHAAPRAHEVIHILGQRARMVNA